MINIKKKIIANFNTQKFSTDFSPDIGAFSTDNCWFSTGSFADKDTFALLVKDSLTESAIHLGKLFRVAYYEYM
jgi:hypothetical protein